jgi:peptidoglycan/xylan/chitin deacetylase (PgdA/CDA1 family)
MALKLKISIFGLLLIFFLAAVIFVLFDQAIIVRKDTIFKVSTAEKAVAITFDDGPSLQWTPKILDELKKADVKATFFMIGKHVEQYPEIARRVAAEGHEIGNHSYDHHGIFFYSPEELDRNIRYAERIIRDITGVTTAYFRPPKAWISDTEKQQVKSMGYQVVLWTLNSKDWVTFDDKYIIKHILIHIQPGDIILFHDSGGVFGTENGDRHETVKTLPRLLEELKSRGYRCVTISELLRSNKG